MAHLIDKDALVAELERLREVQPLDEFQPKEQNKIDWLAGKLFTINSLKPFIDTLEVKEVDLESNDAMNTEIDDSNISCNSTFCSVHTTCKYFNAEKESDVKHCFGGVPMQLKYKKVQSTASKEVDLNKEIDSVEDKYYGFESLSRADIIDIAKHFFELGVNAKQG